MARDYAPPAEDDCPLCGEILNGRLTPTKRGWAHRACVQREQA